MRTVIKKSGDCHIESALQPSGRKPILTHRRAIVTLSVISVLLGLWLLFAVVGTADKEALTGVSRLSVGETWGYMAIALVAFAAGMLGLKSEGVFNEDMTVAEAIAHLAGMLGLKSEGVFNERNRTR